MGPRLGLLLTAVVTMAAPCAWAHDHHPQHVRRGVNGTISSTWKVKLADAADLQPVYARAAGDEREPLFNRNALTDVAPPRAYDPTAARLAAVDPLRGPSTQGLWLLSGGDPRFSRLADADGMAAGWPSVVAVSNGHYDVDFSPHAALGSSLGGESAEAGGMVRLGAHLQDSVMNRLGMHAVDGSAFGDRGRWFLFAAASGRAVGFNMTHDQSGFQRAGWSAEGTSAMISDAQAGLGWRRGNMQASFGYVHREIKTDAPVNFASDSQTVRDSMVAFSFSLTPR